MNEIVIRRNAAAGDIIAATSVAGKLQAAGFDVFFQTHENFHSILRRSPWVVTNRLPKRSGCDINLDGAYENDTERRFKHILDIFQTKAAAIGGHVGQIISSGSPWAPTLVTSEKSRAAILSSWSHLKPPFIGICPKSNNYNNREIFKSDLISAAAAMAGTKVWLGTSDSPSKDFYDMRVRDLDYLMDVISALDLMVTVDTGPMHMAAAFGIPILAITQAFDPKLRIHSDRVIRTVCSPDLDCLNCQQFYCPKDRLHPPCQRISPTALAEAANNMAEELLKVPGNSSSH